MEFGVAFYGARIAPCNTACRDRKYWFPLLTGKTKMNYELQSLELVKNLSGIDCFLGVCTSETCIFTLLCVRPGFGACTCPD